MGQGRRALSMKRREFLGAMAGAAALAGCDSRSPIEGGFAGIDVESGHRLRQPFGGRQAASGGPARRVRVLIAGGGVAGLAAARSLRLAGIEDFCLLDLEAEAGGNSRGGAIGGIAHPLGAHYLPVPGDHAHEVQDLLEEFGLRSRVSGRWRYDERHLCHSPQERLFFRGAWQDSLLPQGDVGAATRDQYRRFAAEVEAVRRALPFRIPTLRASRLDGLLELDALPFGRWLDQRGLDDQHLRWYLSYCCRDDYGAGVAHVSAWAGLHYFAARHGFRAPGDGAPDVTAGASAEAETEPVLTWPEGNAWLTRRLSRPLGDRLQVRQLVTQIVDTRSQVEVESLDLASGQTRRWVADRCIVALPTFVAARVVHGPPAALVSAAGQLRHAPWLVANVHLKAPLAVGPGAAPAWDNVLYGARGLGWVDARHQSLDPTPGPTVLSWYRALGPGTDVALPADGNGSGSAGGDGNGNGNGNGNGDQDTDARRQLLERPWSSWRDEMLAELSIPHPDLPALATRIDITRYGHAMAIPSPGTLARLGIHSRITAGRLAFAHGDWSGYSIFEEAFTRGHLAGEWAAT
ncbi:conserved hypothetical protein [Burkholderiales bacterium 8X]|nr:conserved hypothetical protein [Burkholderiales bacterium 8X]